MEAIYFVTFTNGANLQSDRRLYVKENPSLEKFHKWIEQERQSLEKETGNEFVVLNINYITSARANEA